MNKLELAFAKADEVYDARTRAHKEADSDYALAYAEADELYEKGREEYAKMLEEAYAEIEDELNQ